MAIIVLKAWYLDSVLSAAQSQNAPPDLRLSRTGLLKSGMRADFLDDVDQVKRSLWFQRYLEGELIEFYIEGSGAYSISNLDLISREMYFNKRNTLSHTEPTVMLCGQSDYPESTQAMRKALTQIIEAINRRHSLPLPLRLEESALSEDGKLTIDAALLRKIKQSLLVVGDVTPVASQDPVVPSPQVCVEVGYALQSKRPGQILLVQMQRGGSASRFPFDIDLSSHLLVKDAKDLPEALTTQVMRHLQRSGLFA